MSNIMPTILSQQGLDAAWQWYLFEQIREFVYSDVAKDTVCPKPIIPKKEVDLTTESHQLKHKPTVSRKKALLG